MTRIGLVSTLATLVRRTGSGSVEAIVWLLARELTRLGHDVTVFAAAGSTADCEHVVEVAGTYGSPGMPADYQQCEVLNIATAVARSGSFDVLHSHAYLLGRLFEEISRAAMVHTLHTQPYAAEAALARLRPELSLTAPSRYQWQAFPDLEPVVVEHAVDPAQFTFWAEPERRLCYLGRFMPEKGPLHAIELARALGMPLLLAGPENDYFRAFIRPKLDGHSIEYIGTVDGDARDELLGNSSALVYPVTVGEPFGLVMVESMMCGTPVLSTNIGAAREVVDDGVTGKIASLANLRAAAVETFDLDRAEVRRAAVARFSPERMARGYASVYDAALRRNASRRLAAGRGTR